MKKIFRFLRFFLGTLVILVALLAALFGYFLYSPDPALPALSGALAKGSFEWDGVQRTYRTYVPKGLAKGSPLVMVMHGSGQNGVQIRLETGYGFERLADAYGFAVVYPDAYAFDWNDCSVAGDYAVNGKNSDDAGFLGALVDRLAVAFDTDRSRVFATGVSAGGSMALRLALEDAARFRAIAAVSANLPTAQNFKCKYASQHTSVMFMNGTKDPLVPYAGGESNLLGLFFKGGNVRSSLASAEYFASLAKLTSGFTTTRTMMSDGGSVEQRLWRDGGKSEVELVTIKGGGHGLPQPYYRRARLLGPSPMAPNGAAMIWAFFARQPR